MRYIKTYNQIYEKQTPLEDKREHESSSHYDSEEEARKGLKEHGYVFKGYVSAGEGFEHIWIEQWTRPSQGDDSPIARLLWLGNVKLKEKPEQRIPTLLQGAQVTVIQPGHPKFEEAKQMKLN